MTSNSVTKIGATMYFSCLLRVTKGNQALPQ